MPSLKLTEKAVARLRAPTLSGRQELFWDESLKGFGVLCSAKTGTKTYITQRTLKNGLSRRVTIGQTNVLSLEQAREEAQRVLAELTLGQDPKTRSNRITLAEALEQYLASNNALRDSSRKFYRHLVHRHLSDWLDKPLKDIDADMVAARHSQIQQAVAQSGRSKGFAAANMTMTTLRIVYNAAAERAQGGGSSLPANPVRALKRGWFPAVRRTRMVAFDQLPAFYRAVVGLENAIHRDLILLLMFSGLRLNEAAGLRWQEVDFRAGTVSIPAARMKARKAHVLPMNDVVRDVLVARRALGKAATVFPSNRRVADPRSAFKAIAEQTGIVVSPHDLRRGFLTVGVATGINMLALKTLVAHSTADDITAGYVQLGIEQLREASQQIADKLKTLCGIVEAAGVEKLHRS